MIDLPVSLLKDISSAAPHLVMALVDLTLKGSLIVLAALFGSALLRARPAAQRHLVWTTALLLVLLLPVLNVFLPEVPLPLLSTGLFIEQTYSMPITSVEVATSYSANSFPVTEQDTSEPSMFYGLGWKFWLAGLWVFGGLLAAIWIIGGKLKAASYLRWSQPIGDQNIHLIVNRLAKSFGIKHTFRVRKSNAVKVPVVIGVLKKTILLPSDAVYWPEEKLETMLLHELAHIKRHDTLMQVPAQIVSAFLWFNPLVWFAAQKQIKEREKAADDMVINAGIKASNYAGYLLEAAQRLTNNQNYNWATMGMARGADFKSRVRAIVNSSTNRKPMSLETALVTFLTFALLMLPLAAWQMWDTGIAAANDSASDVIESPGVFGTQESEVLTLTDEMTKPEVTFRGVQLIPAKAKIEKIGGTVKVKLIIRKNGSYEVTEILKEDPPGYGFADATKEYLTKSTWKPAMLSDEPVDVYFTLTIIFNLAGNKTPPKKFDDIKSDEVILITHREKSQVKKQEEEDKEDAVEISGNITKPRVTFSGKQPYPDKAKQAGEEGYVKVRLIIRKDGSYEIVEIVKEKPEGYSFGDALKEYMTMSVWQPATQNGKAIDVYYELTIKFTLAGKSDDPIYDAGSHLGLKANLQEPELVHRVEPKYPEAARKAGVEGFVLMQVIINKKGDVADIKILQTPPAKYGFAEAAREAVQQWKFKPTIYKGKPVSVRIRFSVEFDLEDKTSAKEKTPPRTAGNFEKPEVRFIGEKPFPEKALILRQPGIVKMRLLVRATGFYEIKEILEATPSNFGFESAAREYMKQSVWTPAMRDGKPTDVYYDLTVTFNIKGEEEKTKALMDSLSGITNN